MKKLLFSMAACAALLGAAAIGSPEVVQAQAVAAPAASTADPSAQQIYQAARAGDLARAQQMVERVLHDHPGSAKAHYVAAEVYARSGDLSRARAEFNAAESLSPGLTFASPRAVQQLQQQLSGRRILYGTPVRQSHGISWGVVLLIGALGALAFALLRRRTAAPYGAGYGPYGQQAAGYPGASPYGSYPPSAGPGLMGSLATGLAVGAGVAAGEELVHHALNHGSTSGGVISGADAAEPAQMPNADMGGNDFGLSDASSWDGGGSDPFGGDAGGGDFGGGGGDWT